jgi:hypothetical protein
VSATPDSTQNLTYHNFLKNNAYIKKNWGLIPLVFYFPKNVSIMDYMKVYFLVHVQHNWQKYCENGESKLLNSLPQVKCLSAMGLYSQKKLSRDEFICDLNFAKIV